MSGISRSAFYKYKDSIHEYDPHLSDSMMTLYFSLEDEPGVLSSVINNLYTLGANIITINQNIPIDGVAPVTISIRLGNSTSTPEHLKATLSALTGVVKVKEI